MRPEDGRPWDTSMKVISISRGREEEDASASMPTRGFVRRLAWVCLGSALGFCCLFELLCCSWVLGFDADTALFCRLGGYPRHLRSQPRLRLMLERRRSKEEEKGLRLNDDMHSS